jgi:hypothetical protein
MSRLEPLWGGGGGGGGGGRGPPPPPPPPMHTYDVRVISDPPKSVPELVIVNMSLQYRNKSKSQLTSPTPAQLPAVAVSSGHIVCTRSTLSSRSDFCSAYDLFLALFLKHYETDQGG